MLKEKCLCTVVMIAMTVLASACADAPDPSPAPAVNAAPTPAAPSSYTFGNDESHPALSNKAGPYDLGVPIEKGATIVIRPISLRREKRAETPPQKTRTRQ